MMLISSCKLSIAILAIIIGALVPSSIAGQSLLEKSFRAEADAEVLLDLTASARNTSWKERGNEAAVATIYVDGRYNQDIVIHTGTKAFNYQIILGRFPAGEHALRVEFNRKRSAAKAQSIQIDDARVSIVDRTAPEHLALSHAPVVCARPNAVGRFSDIPLLMWYETHRTGSTTTFRYSIIFSNEDGGTQTGALMARWGRTTDIEWLYEVQIDARGKISSATYQGVEHKTRPFRGKQHNGHPVLHVVSDNNNFSDRGESQMRTALRPVAFDPGRASREEIMDRNAWIYQVMAAELEREGKIAETSRAGNQMIDPRRYLYIEAASEQRGTALSFAVKLKGNSSWYTSDLGINYYKIDRSGFFRTTVQLPAGTSLDQIEQLAVRCDAAGNPKSGDDIRKLSAAGCELKVVNKVFMLDKDFLPGPPLAIQFQPLKLRAGEMIELRNGRNVSAAGSNHN